MLLAGNTYLFSLSFFISFCLHLLNFYVDSFLNPLFYFILSSIKILYIEIN